VGSLPDPLEAIRERLRVELHEALARATLVERPTDSDDQPDFQPTLGYAQGVVAGLSAGMNGAGGGLYVDDFSSATLTGATVSNNQAAYEGGGVWVGDSSTLQATASTIASNRTTSAAIVYGGGGIWMADSQVSLNSTLVSWNSSADFGGGIAYYGHNQMQQGLTIASSMIDHNTAAFSGGGIYSKASLGPASVTLDGSTVAFNRVTNGDGGGISNYGECNNTASLVATNSAFGGNLAKSGEGGAIYNSNGVACGSATALVTLSKTFVGQIGYTLNPNQARYGGGIFNENGDGFSSVSLQPGTNVVHNTASVNGGGVFNCGGASLSIVFAVLLFNSPNNIATPAICPA
jgi:fibronectin-binding autotransporter adhesin